MLKNLAGLIIAFSFAACTSHVETPTPSESSTTATTKTNATYTPITFELENREDEPTDAERMRCTDAGGTVQRDGILGFYRCTQDLPDGGKACSNSSECLGRCLVQGEVADDGTAVGACQRTDSPFGCFSMVENGRATPGFCVD